MHFMTNFTRFVLITAIFFFSHHLFAANEQPLPADVAFELSGTFENHALILNWDIKPGYYLYKDRISYKIVSPQIINDGKIILPEGIQKEDTILGKYEALEGNIHAQIPVKSPKGSLFNIKVCFQGCSENGFCYPPDTKELIIDSSQAGKIVKSTPVTSDAKKYTQSEQEKITDLLGQQSLIFVLASFFAFGLLLTFTPCILPMIPILSGIIAGHNETKTGHSSFWLSTTYVLAMALTYAVAGILAAYVGQSLQAALQSPIAIIIFSFIFVLLSLSLFGFYELRLPHHLSERISEWSNHQKGGTYIGVIFMGILSTLIVSPCVTPPLIGALTYISNSGNMILGGAALFCMGLGMGLPLIIIGTSGGKLIPKAGAWMIIVERILGALLLATAIWMISRIIPGQVSMLLWAAFLIISSVYMGLLNPLQTSGWGQLWRALGLVFCIYGIILMIGAAIGNTNPLQPLITSASAHLSPVAFTQGRSAQFEKIKTNDDFDRQLQQALENHQITMLDFYADWCISCKEMEEFTFSNTNIQSMLAPLKRLKADVTANDIQDKILMERFGVIAPPAILFFDTQGNEIPSMRIIGYLSPEQFTQKLEEMKKIENKL